jgi:hypothetical protein
VFCRTRAAYRTRLRKNRAEETDAGDAKEAIGHGVRAKRSKSGAISFNVLETEAIRASIQ